MLSEAATDRVRREAEVCDLDRSVVGHASELVPPRESAVVFRHVQPDLGLRQMGGDLGVGPPPPVAPVVRFTDRPIAEAVQLRARLRDVPHDEPREFAEGLLELSWSSQLEIRSRGLHGLLGVVATGQFQVYFIRMSHRMTTVPLPLSLHLAAYSVIGLFCLMAGGLNFIDPTKILHGVAFLTVTGLSWGHVFGIYMGRREVVALGFALSAVYVGFGVWQLPIHPWLGLLLVAIGVYGAGALYFYRKQILAV